MVADTPEQPIDLKTFCCRLSADFPALSAEEAAFKPLPIVRKVTDEMLLTTFNQVRADIRNVVQSELARISSTIELRHLLID